MNFSMAYDEEKLMNSQKAVQILAYMESKEEGSFPKEISEEVGVHTSTASEIIRQMRELNFVKRSKRSQAQYYKVNYDGLSDFWISKIKDLYPDQTQIQVMGQVTDASYPDFSSKEETTAKNFFELYIQEILKTDISDKLSNIMFESLFLSLTEYEQENNTVINDLDKVKIALKTKFKYGYSTRVIDSVLKELDIS